MAVLEVKGLWFSYFKEPILKDISFSIEKGEFVSIVGPNGSGKTTLLKCISKILSFQKGSIKLFGQDIKVLNPRKIAKKIASVPQETHIIFSFSCLEVVLMGRSPHLGRFQMEGKEDLKVAQEAMRLTDTIDLSDRSIHSLSSGERQRVIIARALAQRPKILLLDEPTSHLDINHQQDIFDLLAKLNAEQELTIICVLHDLNLASLYSRRLILLRKGKIYADGQPKEVITSKNINEVYGAKVLLSENPKSQSPHIMLVPKQT
jgi:iron complex transport system ATP-binding protein